MNKRKLVATLVVFLLTTVMLPIVVIKTEAQNIPEIEDPTPGYWETSEYMIGKIAVGIILPESNGSIDVSTEDWTDAEIQKVLSEIQIALDWWASQNPSANVSFIKEVYARVPTSYEPINRSESDVFKSMSEVISYLGYPLYGRWEYQMRDFANALREKYKTDWAFTIFVFNSKNDSDGAFSDGGAMRSEFGGTCLYMTYDNAVWGIDNMDRVCAHEIAHTFWADDEYFPPPPTYSGYINVSNVPRSGCLMDANAILKLSGAPYGQNGTWGQVGWRDSDGDGIQDIVDTNQNVYINSPVTIGNKLNFTGVATVTSYPNKNPNHHTKNVTINIVQSVEYRVDDGAWTNTTITPWKFEKLVKYPSTYEYKETYAVVNFTFLTEGLSPGQHFVEVKATNQWGNAGYSNVTVTVPETVHDVAITEITPYRSILSNDTSTNVTVTVQNQGDSPENFNVTLYYNTSTINVQTVNLDSGKSTILTFTWNTTGSPLGNYTLTATAAPVSGETDISDNTLIFSLIQVSITGDIDANGEVDILDISIAAIAFDSTPDGERWNSIADVNEDGTIDIVDITIIAVNFGVTM